MKDKGKAQPAGGGRAGADVIGAAGDVDSAIISHPHCNTKDAPRQEESAARWKTARPRPPGGQNPWWF